MTNLLLFVPFAVMQCYYVVGTELEMYVYVPKIGYQIPAILFWLNFNVNSILYVFWIRTFQQSATVLCCCDRQQTNIRRDM